MTRFQKTVSSGDAASLGEMLTYDAVYEDMALHAQILGKSFGPILASIVVDRLRHFWIVVGLTSKRRASALTLS